MSGTTLHSRSPAPPRSPPPGAQPAGTRAPRAGLAALPRPSGGSDPLPAPRPPSEGSDASPRPRLPRVEGSAGTRRACPAQPSTHGRRRRAGGRAWSGADGRWTTRGRTRRLARRGAAPPGRVALRPGTEPRRGRPPSSTGHLRGAEPSTAPRVRGPGTLPVGRRAPTSSGRNEKARRPRPVFVLVRRPAGLVTRRRWDLNPRKGCPFTTLAGSRTRPDYATSPDAPPGYRARAAGTKAQVSARKPTPGR